MAERTQYTTLNGRNYFFYDDGKGSIFVSYEDKSGKESERIENKAKEGGYGGEYTVEQIKQLIYENEETKKTYVTLGVFLKGNDGKYEFLVYPVAFEKENGNEGQAQYFTRESRKQGPDVYVENIFTNSSPSEAAAAPTPAVVPQTSSPQVQTEAERQIQQAIADKKVLADTIVSASEALRPDLTKYDNQNLIESTSLISERLDKNFDEISKIILPETDTQPKESLAKRIQEIGITENVLNDPRLTEEQRQLLRQYQDDKAALDAISNEFKERAKKACPKSLELGNSWSKATSDQIDGVQKSCKDGFNFTELAAKVADIEKKQLETGNPCGTGVLAGISNALTNFFDTLKGIKKYYNLYVNGAINKISNITSLVSKTSQIIGSILKLLVQRMRNYILNLLRKLIEKAIDKILNKLSKALKNTVIKTIVDSLICKFNDIIKGLKNFVVDFLYALIGNVVNAPVCAVEQFTNTLINSLSAKIDSALQPVLGAINDVLGGVVKIAGQIFDAINFVLGFEALLCSRPKCPQIKSWRASAGAGPTPAMEDQWNRIINFIPDADKIESTILEQSDAAIGRLLPGISIFGDKRIEGSDLSSGTPPPGVQCFPGAFRCGPPKVQFFGGNGVGAAGNAVVNSIGQIVGVDLVYGGSGYTAPPFVTFVDNCSDENPGASGGFGASAYTVINPEGRVVAVVMVNNGSKYLNYVPGITESDTPAIINPNEEIVTREYVTCLDKIDIVNTGIGYLPTDTISITPDLPGLEVKVQITEVGQIVSMDVLTSGCGFSEIPEITINSDTGVGLQVRPRMRFIDRKTYLETQPDFVLANLVSVIDCVQR